MYSSVSDFDSNEDVNGEQAVIVPSAIKLKSERVNRMYNPPAVNPGYFREGKVDTENFGRGILGMRRPKTKGLLAEPFRFDLLSKSIS